MVKFVLQYSLFELKVLISCRYVDKLYMKFINVTPLDIKPLKGWKLKNLTILLKVLK